MGKIRIVTDSTADIPKEVRERLGISMVPLKVMFGEETFLDMVSIEPEQFYEKLAQSEHFPTTSQPSPQEFLELYERLIAEDPDSPIISIHVSAALSGTYQSATIAQTMLEGNPDVTVIDAKSASYGTGLRVVKAAEMAQAGESKERIIEVVEQMLHDTKVYFLVDTLENLQKGGRIGKASALIGSILNVKPVLSLDPEGIIYAIDKVRGSKKAMARIISLLKQEFGDEPVNVTIAWTNANPAAEALTVLVREQFNIQEMDSTVVGAVVGTHAGLGTAAVFMRRA